MQLDRRGFFKVSTAAVAAGTAFYVERKMAFLQSAPGITNPLQAYPNRGWEKIYRDQYAYDDSFTFVCAPNDTHMCRLRAMVRNGVVVRIEQNYDGGLYEDPQGNSSSVAWNPRACLKGYTLHRRVYGPYRAKNPAIRQGWKQWADDGFPPLSDDPSLRSKYKFDARGEDQWVRMSWDEANDYVAKALVAIAKAYSGDEGGRRLIDKDGYPEEMLEHLEGAGTRTMKFGSSLPPHGVAGKFGPFRFANMLALLDAQARNVGPDEAKGGRGWSEYTWRGDQAPGFPFVHGLQSTETDFNDLRHSKLLVMIGKNLVENKMADSHFFHETMERGGKIVTIVPEYGPPATKSDYWIPVRPGLSDTALLLGVAKALIDRDLVDVDFVKRFTDLPLLVRLDTLKRLRADELIAGYSAPLDPAGPSMALHGMTADQAKQNGDRVVFDSASNSLRPLSREDVGDRMMAKKIDPALDYRGKAKLADGTEVEVASVLTMYREHLKDYDLDTVVEITGAPKNLIERLITDLATIKPAAIHIGEGVNHYFHATLHNRAAYLLAMLTGNIGRYGSGVSTWAGNYKGGIFHAAPWYGPGVGGYANEDPFNPVLDPAGRYTAQTTHEYKHDEETAYWGFGDRPLIVDTPTAGRKVFTGTTHMPTPTKVLWFNNANLINQAKWAYHLIKNVNPKVDMIVDQEIEWTGSTEFSDVCLPANSWLEAQTLEMGGSCSNPFLQIWKGGIPSLNDTRDDVEIFAGVANALTKVTGESRFADYFKFSKTPEVYLDRVLAASFTTKGYTVEDIMAGKYGVKGGALFQYRSYPRIPFKEQVEDSLPFYTDTGRMNAYVDIPEAIEYGENLIVHREAVEATRYLPNVIVSTSPYIRPTDYGISLDTADPDLRAVRNIKMAWSQVKATANPLWDQGFQFFFLTPKSRHSTHSSWAVTDWNWIWNSNFSDVYREEKRMPGIGDVQIHMNPEDAAALGISDGDYVWIDANPADRPYIGADKDPSSTDVARLMGRANFNPGFPRGVTMLKHAYNMATPRTVRAQKERPDGRALAAETGYQASFRHGSQQSVTRGWAPPMHQTDSLFHKKVGGMGFVFGFDEDNHAINTTPKETLVRITKAEDGGLAGSGLWKPGTSGMSPAAESDFMKRYLAGSIVTVTGVQ
ncbi:MAG: nitrate oxidoreductase subunit alpha [Chloroflexi bacterium]|nr:nitrate oxidoreductase subunit alpha [Chloroflexota bacterium]PWB45272.1 MAG: nitrate oxidoreductase subunit alpha [Dehalococcoidia bacterium]